MQKRLYTVKYMSDIGGILDEIRFYIFIKK